jgi:beta-N-acetylhexosaminidase
MGLAIAEDVDLTRRLAEAHGRQMKAVGIDWLHSPVLDVNTTPENPEIGTRSFGPDADVVARHGAAMLQGFEAAGLVATAKHFPGRGASAEDAHYACPTIQESRERMEEIHLAP